MKGSDMDNNTYISELLSKNSFSSLISDKKINLDDFPVQKIGAIPKDLLTLFFSYFEYNSSEVRYEYYLRMLYKLIENQDYFLRSYIVIFNELELDELNMIKYLLNGEISVVDTMDLDRINNKFDNQKIVRTDMKNVDIRRQENERLYIDHLISRGVIEWPVYKQDPIVTNNTQTGITRYSKILLTSFGKGFAKYIFE
jgi:hypothetical protein